MRSNRLRAGIGAVLSLALALGYTVFTAGAPSASAAQLDTPAPLEERNAQTVTADVLPTAQIDSGVVWATVVIGNTVYAGGSFSAARPAGAEPGVNTVARSNLLAFDLTTGVLTSFAPTFNGPIKALAASPDGARLYVGGTFTQVNGQTRWNFATFDTSTGALSSYHPAVGGSYVNAIAATSSAVYVGGLIGAGNGVIRKNLAAFSTSGQLLAWAPTTDLQVDAMVLTPHNDKLIVGGRFALVNGVSQRGLVALDMNDGSILPWIAPSVVKNGWNEDPYSGKAGIYSLSADANAIYGTGWVYANATVGNLEGAFSADPDTGAIKWLDDCHGDTYSSYSDGTNVYLTGHNHDCYSLGGFPQAYPAPGNLRHSIALTAETKGTLARSDVVSSIYQDWSGQPAPAMINWYPDWVTGTATGQGQAGWTATGKGDYLVIGGEFPYVNGKRQQGLVRFARPNVSGSHERPRLASTRWQPTARSFMSGQVVLTIPANWDRDNINLTYTVTRSGTAGPVFTKTMDTNFWTLPSITFTDTGLTPGQTYTYQAFATDSDGNTSESATTQVTVSDAVLPSYSAAVVADGASTYWRLGGSDGAFDLMGNVDGLVGTGVSDAASGALNGDTGVGYAFDGTSNGLISTTTSPSTPTVFSLEGWFRTTTNRGGKLFGYGSAQTGSSSSYDRHLYMTNDGRLIFGVWNNHADTLATSSSFNDGAWHHVVAGLGASGMVLYVDGQLAGSNSVTTAQAYGGYWRIGGDNLGGWPSQPSSSYFAGDLDEFAIYPTVLDATAVQDHYRLGLGAAAPTAEFTSQVADLSVTFDPSASTAEAGQTIVSYEWDFGDGTTGTGSNPTHVFPDTGDYPVTLTVVDSRGVSGSVTHTVTVHAPHSAPVPAISTTVDLATVTADASGSTTSDGATLSYAWDWGDGSPADSGETASHTYAASGRYTITLTLTDSWNFTSTLTRSVIVSTTPLPAYTTDVLADGASLYWRLGGTSGAWDQLGNNDGVVGAGVSDAASGALGSSGGAAYSFSGTSTGLVASSAVAATPSVFSLEGWFKTASTSGGKLFGYGNAQSGSSGSYDRHLYMTNDGRLIFGVWNNQADVVTSPDSYNNGSWHHVVAGLGPSGMVLYVDGQLVASNSVTTAQAFTGYWRVGGDNLNGWPSQPSSSYFAGDLDEFAVYPTELSASTVLKHFQDATAGAAPSAAFSWTPTDLSVSFDASGTAVEPGESIASYDWDFGDGSTDTSANPTHVYSTTGSYLVQLTVTDSRGLTDAVTHIVTVLAPHTDPTAAFTPTVSGLSVDVDASASSASDGATLTYEWNWGDGSSTDTGQTASHIYAVAGDYTITLTVTDSLDASATASEPVSVAHTAPVVSLVTVVEGLSVDADASASSASDGATLSYEWNWGDGSPTGTGKTASHTYAVGGDYTITLTVTDSMGASGSTDHPISVAHADPTASFTSPMQGLSVDVDASGSAAFDGATLSYEWNWGDGSPTGTGKTASHTYAVAGDYTITLTVTDSMGASATASASITAEHTAPVASFTHSEDGLSTAVNASASTASDGDSLTYSWNWGDGSPAGSGKTASHDYATDGDYQVTLTVTDEHALSDTATKTVTVAHADPVASFTASDTGLQVDVDGSGSTASDSATLEYAWQWGDGSADGSGKTDQHTYAASGTYTIKLTVTDSLGSSDSATKSVTVTDPSDTTRAKGTFSTDVDSGWGSATVGGDWTTTGSGFSVAGGVGSVQVKVKDTKTATLGDVSVRDQSGQVEMMLDKLPAASSMHVNFDVRKTSAGGYRVKARFYPDGTVNIMIAKLVGTSETALALKNASLTYAAGERLTVAFDTVTASGTTSLKAKAWLSSGSEPSSWLLSTSDSTSALSVAGAVGIQAYMPSSVTNPPIVVSVDNLLVTAVS